MLGKPGVSQASEKGWGGAGELWRSRGLVLLRQCVCVCVCSFELREEKERSHQNPGTGGETETEMENGREERESESESPAEGVDPPLPDPREVGRRREGVREGSWNSSLKMNPRSRARGPKRRAAAAALSQEHRGPRWLQPPAADLTRP